MRKIDILTKMKEAGIIAVVRANSPEKALKTTDAVIKGGVVGIELTFTVPQADKVIAQLTSKYKDNPNVVIGAGTVLDPPSARIAIINGAQFIVSPSFNAEVAKICNLYEIPYTPGCMTPTEIQQALETGVDIVKIFPGNVVSYKMIADLKGPFPYLTIMPTGGVSLDNLQDWFKAGVALVGAGSNLTSGANSDNYTQVTQMAEKYHDKLLEIRKEMNLSPTTN